MSNSGLSPAAAMGGKNPTDKVNVVSTSKQVQTKWVSGRTLQPSSELVVINFLCAIEFLIWKAMLVDWGQCTPFSFLTSSAHGVMLQHNRTTLLKLHLVQIVSSFISKLLLMVQREPLQAVCHHIALSLCTVVSKVNR